MLPPIISTPPNAAIVCAKPSTAAVRSIDGDDHKPDGADHDFYFLERGYVIVTLMASPMTTSLNGIDSRSPKMTYRPQSVG